MLIGSTEGRLVSMYNIYFTKIFCCVLFRNTKAFPEISGFAVIIQISRQLSVRQYCALS